MKSATLRLLLDGQYVCAVAYGAEYNYLVDDVNRKHADDWLNAIDMRLSQVNDGGAFFMAPITLESEQLSRIREDFLKFRDVYGPQVRFISLIRSGKEDFNFQQGDTIQLAQLYTAVNSSTTLETLLRNYAPLIRDGSAVLNNHELLKRMLSHLVRDGLLILLNSNTDVYQFTGKLEQLLLAIQVAAEHQPVVSLDDEQVSAPKPVQGDMLDDLQNGAAANHDDAGLST